MLGTIDRMNQFIDLAVEAGRLGFYMKRDHLVAGPGILIKNKDMGVKYDELVDRLSEYNPEMIAFVVARDQGEVWG